MVIFNEIGQIVQNPDLNAGYIIEERMLVMFTWVIDAPEVTEEVVLKEYPNGGKDIGVEVVSPEEGHWEVTDENGDPVEHFDGEIPEDLPHDVPVPDVWQFQRYIPYTAEELAQRESDRLEAEAAQVKAEEREVMLEELPATQAATDAAICELFEMMLEAN